MPVAMKRKQQKCPPNSSSASHQPVLRINIFAFVVQKKKQNMHIELAVCTVHTCHRKNGMLTTDPLEVHWLYNATN